MDHRDHLVEVRAAEPDAVAREHPHRVVLDDKGGEIRGAAADIDDQAGAAARPQLPACERRGLGLEEELNLVEARREIAVPEIGLGPSVARRIGGVKVHRAAGERPPEPDPRRRLGPLAQRANEGGDDVRERLSLAADHSELMHERAAQHAL